jgi:hypothetical protein
MSTKQIFYSIFYLVALAAALYTGFKFGFTGTHTPPLPFILEFLCFPLGMIDLLGKKNHFLETEIRYTLIFGKPFINKTISPPTELGLVYL